MGEPLAQLINRGGLTALSSLSSVLPKACRQDLARPPDRSKTPIVLSEIGRSARHLPKL